VDTNRTFQFYKRSELFIGVYNEPLSVVAMRIDNPDCPPFVVKGCGIAQTPSGFAEIVSDDFRITSRPERAMLGLNFAQAGSARNGSESGVCSWEDGHANRAKPCSAS
jgi:hypothetical protein